MSKIRTKQFKNKAKLTEVDKSWLDFLNQSEKKAFKITDSFRGNQNRKRPKLDKDPV